MPGGERDDGLSPVCHPTPRPPSCPLPYWQKRPKTFPRQTRVGEGMNRSRALYQNAANLSLLRWQICKDSYCNILSFFFFFKAISWVIGSCFDYTTLTISLPGWLCCTVKDHRAVFPLPSAHPHTNMSTQTEKHCTLCNFGMLNIPWPANGGLNMLSFLGCFRFRETK